MAQFNIYNLKNHSNVRVRDNSCAWKKIQVCKKRFGFQKCLLFRGTQQAFSHRPDCDRPVYQFQVIPNRF